MMGMNHNPLKSGRLTDVFSNTPVGLLCVAQVGIRL
jgi:hypothetical protein